MSNYECFIDTHETSHRKVIFIELMNKSRFRRYFSQVKPLNLRDKGDVGVYKEGKPFFGAEFVELEDLIGKVISGRYKNQALELTNTYPYRAFIVNRENTNLNDYISKIEENQVIEKITSIYFELGVSVYIWDSSYQQLYSCVKAIEHLVDPNNKKHKEKIRPKIKTSDMFVAMLSQIEGINKGKCVDLKKKFKTIAKLSEVRPQLIQKIPGIGSELASRIYNALHGL